MKVMGIFSAYMWCSMLINAVWIMYKGIVFIYLFSFLPDIHMVLTWADPIHAAFVMSGSMCSSIAGIRTPDGVCVRNN